MSKYLDDRFPDLRVGRAPARAVSPHDAPPGGSMQEDTGAYRIRQWDRWDNDVLSASPFDAERTSPCFVASPRSRLANAGRSLSVEKQTTGRRAAPWQWLSHLGATRKGTLAGALAVVVILSGLLIAIGPARQQADAAPLAIYDGSLAPGWQTTAFHSTVNPANMASANGAGHPMAWALGARWSALFMRAKGPISLAGYSSLTLSMQLAHSGQWYGVAALTKDGRIAASIKPLAGFGRQPTPSAWKQYSISISSLAPHTSTINGIGLFAWSGESEHANPMVYLDRITLLGTAVSAPIQSATATNPPTPSLPTGSASAPTSTSVPASTASPSGQTSSTTAPAPAGSTFDGQGIYDSCAPDKGTTCLDHLNQIASGGLRLVVNYDQMYGTASQQLAYLDRAKAVGVRVIFGMSDPAFWDGTNLRSKFSELAATCGCSDNTGFIRYVVNLVKGHSALWGYYIGDEVSPSNEAAVQTFSNLVRQADPSHPRLYVAIGGWSTTNNLSPFGSVADVLGADFYPVGENDGSVYTTPNGAATVTRAVQAVATTHGNSSGMVLQAFSWKEYPGGWGCGNSPSTCSEFPTEAQMEQMRNLALQNGHLRVILWYSYFDILRSDNPTQHWHDLVTAVNASFPSNALTR